MNQLITKKVSQNELAWVFFILTSFLFINFITSAYSPIPWYDEVFYTSPGVNLYLGKGFTSAAWPGWSAENFWAAYVPLYPLLLCVWLKIFGFGIMAARSMNYFFAVLMGLLLWFSSLRFQWIHKAHGRVIFLAAMLFNFDVALSYRSGRQDGLAMLLASMALFSLSIHRKWIRYTALFLVSILCMWTQLPLAVYGVVLGFLFMLIFDRRFFAEYVIMIIGFFAGFFLVLKFYSFFGEADAFMQYNNRYIFWGQNILSKFQNFYIEFPPPGSLILAGGLILFFIFAKKYFLDFHLRLIIFGFSSSIIVPLSMHFAGHFHQFYYWLIFAPLGVCAGILAFDTHFSHHKKFQRILIATLILTVATGLPTRLGLMAIEKESRDHSKVEKFVNNHIAESDTVYADLLVYYAVKKVSKEAYMSTYTLNQEESKKIDVMVIRTDNFMKNFMRFRGHWKLVGRFEAPSSWSGRMRTGGKIYNVPKYRLAIYRRYDSLQPETKYFDPEGSAP